MSVSYTQEYVPIPNCTVRDKRLSRSARGLLVELLSLPADVRVTSETLAENGPEGRDAIRRMLSELEQAGYISRPREQDERGRWTRRLIVREIPETGTHGR